MSDALQDFSIKTLEWIVKVASSVYFSEAEMHRFIFSGGDKFGCWNTL